MTDTHRRCVSALILTAVPIARAGSSLRAQGVDTSLPGLWDLGFGRVQTVAIIDSDWHPNLTSSVLLANLPQFLFPFYISLTTASTLVKWWCMNTVSTASDFG